MTPRFFAVLPTTAFVAGAFSSAGAQQRSLASHKIVDEFAVASRSDARLSLDDAWSAHPRCLVEGACASSTVGVAYRSATNIVWGDNIGWGDSIEDDIAWGHSSSASHGDDRAWGGAVDARSASEGGRR